MTCPFKTKTTYTKQIRTPNAKTNTWDTHTVTCAAKEAHTVEHGFGTCDGSACPYYDASSGVVCKKVAK